VSAVDAASENLTVQGLPLMKPPYSRITAINLDTGDFRWQVPFGATPDNIRNHPALKGLNLPPVMGRSGNNPGTLVTKTLVIAGEHNFGPTPSGQRGAMLRAYDKATGKELGAVYMAAPQSGSPMTYMLNGKQYIVVAISGGSHSGELLAFRVPGAGVGSGLRASAPGFRLQALGSGPRTRTDQGPRTDQEQRTSLYAAHEVSIRLPPPSARPVQRRLQTRHPGNREQNLVRRRAAHRRRRQ
jgi:hypothetical protein